MYLSRLILNPRSRQVQREIADPYEMHRTVMSAFSERLSATERILFRLEIHPRTGLPSLLVQSQEKPDWSFLNAPMKTYLLPQAELPPEVENPSVKPLDLHLHIGQVLAFRLRANPTVKKDREDKKQGRRVGLYREEDQLIWLQRKIDSAGCTLVSANLSNESRLNSKLFREGEKHNLRFLAVQFDGVLKVNDPEQLVVSVQTGIGSGKGLGFGLLSLAPYQS